MAEPELSEDDVAKFVDRGVVRLPEAFPRELADRGRDVLAREAGVDTGDPTTWTQPVVRLGGYSQEPFAAASDTPRLRAAFDQLVGEDVWKPLGGLGTFPLRFPHPDDPGDTGWHVDASFAGEQGEGRLNLRSHGRALLMLFLFSDVGEDDAPTVARAGSHLDVARLLEPYGEAGAEFFELSAAAEAASAHRPTAPATGRAGDVYLCHPFLVHSAQPHRGSTPKFMAQPPLPPAAEFDPHGEDGPHSPVAEAIRRGLGR